MSGGSHRAALGKGATGRAEARRLCQSSCAIPRDHIFMVVGRGGSSALCCRWSCCLSIDDATAASDRRFSFLNLFVFVLGIHVSSEGSGRVRKFCAMNGRRARTCDFLHCSSHNSGRVPCSCVTVADSTTAIELGHGTTSRSGNVGAPARQPSVCRQAFHPVLEHTGYDMLSQIALQVQTPHLFVANVLSYSPSLSSTRYQ